MYLAVLDDLVLWFERSDKIKKKIKKKLAAVKSRLYNLGHHKVEMQRDVLAF